MILKYTETFVKILEVIGKYSKEPMSVDKNVINVETEDVDIFAVIAKDDVEILNDDKSTPDEDEDIATFLNVAEVSSAMESFPSYPKITFDEEYIWFKSGRVKMNLNMGDTFLVTTGKVITMSKHKDKEIDTRKYIGDIILGQKRVKAKSFDFGIDIVDEKREIVTARTIEEEFNNGFFVGEETKTTQYFRFSIDAAKLIDSLDEEKLTSYILFKNNTAILLLKVDFPDTDSFVVFKYTSLDIE